MKYASIAVECAGMSRDNQRVVFPDSLEPDETGLVGWGADLSVSTLLEAYSKGIFPWSGENPIPWYSPDPRLIMEPAAFRASRSLRKLERQGRYIVRYDVDFRAVMHACATSPRPGQGGTWINGRLIDAYEELHRMGVAHSVEVRRSDDGRLVGGLYGLNMGRAFFGESMFSREPNASKLGLWTLCRDLHALEFGFVDCQQQTSHLMSLGAISISRADYLARLRAALLHPSQHYSWCNGLAQPL